MNLNQYQVDRLVEEAQNGNMNAFGELYDIFFPHIHKYVYYKIGSDHADDLTGTIFMKSWLKLKKYRKTSYPFSAWLFRVAHNSVIDHYRTHRTFFELEEKIAEDDSRNPQHLMEKTLNKERVHRALHHLGKNYQEVLVLKFLNEMSNREVADIMKTNESNVRTLQFRALKKMREVLEEQEAPKKAEAVVEKKEPVGFLRRIFAKSS